MITTTELYNYNYKIVTKFQLKLTFLFLRVKFIKKNIYRLLNQKNSSILNFAYSSFKQNLSLNRHALGGIYVKMVFLVQNKKVGSNTKFCKNELIFLPEFMLNLQDWLFGISLLEKYISWLEKKNITPLLNNAYLNRYSCQISTSIDNFNFKLDFPKKGIFFR